MTAKRAKKSPRIGPQQLDALKRAAALVRLPEGQDPLAQAVKRLKLRTRLAEEKTESLKQEVSSLAARPEAKGPPYTFDYHARAITRLSTGRTYCLHQIAYEFMDVLHKRWQEGKPPILAVQLTQDGRRGVHDAFVRPRTLDGKDALNDLVVRYRGRLSLRVP